MVPYCGIQSPSPWHLSTSIFAGLSGYYLNISRKFWTISRLIHLSQMILSGLATEMAKTVVTTHDGGFCHSVAKSCPTLWDPVDCSKPGFPVLYYLLEFSQTHVHWISDAIQPSHPLSSPSPFAFNLSQHQGSSQWIGSSHQMAKILGLERQHQSFQWIFTVDFF